MFHKTAVKCVLMFVDYDECAVNNGNCQQLCYNLIPGHQCDCLEGYTLDEDGQTCKGLFQITCAF